MPKDREKFQYYEVGILRDSDLHRDILADAEASQMPGHIPLLLAARLSEYYALRRAGAIPALSATASKQGEHIEESDVVTEAPPGVAAQSALGYEWPD